MYVYIFVHLLSNNLIFNFVNVILSRLEMSPESHRLHISLIDISHSSRIK